MQANPNYVGKSLNGKEIVDVSADGKFVNFYFVDGSYDVAPIIDGVVKVEFDDVVIVEDVVEAEVASTPDPMADIIPLAELTEEESELGFYKTLQPIPYTDEEGNELGKTEVGSTQEVPVALGDMWVKEGWAEKVDVPVEETLGSKIAGAFNGLLGNK